MNEILLELIGLKSPLAGFSREMPYAVPEGYFSKLADELSAHQSLTAIGGTKSMPYTTPGGYFDELAEMLAASAKEGILDGQISTPFEAPAGYFENLPAILLKAAKEAGDVPQHTRRIHIPKRMIQWAAAAVLVLGISLGSHFYIQSRTPNAIANRQLLKVDGEALGQYVEQHADEFDAENIENEVASSKVDLQTTLSTIDEQEIQNYLNQTGDTTTTTLN